MSARGLFDSGGVAEASVSARAGAAAGGGASMARKIDWRYNRPG
jgi:hypothetical protein